MQVNSGFRTENTGRIKSLLAERLSMPFSCVITEPVDPSLPAAVRVKTVATGNAFSILFPV
ncbi:hypothetical protein SDC9_155586 [bioreactor metagenome]|uniref:Uncharacterized protein n=1 Tax=bioreactor metagenome TaxID=1076179 RepID=A0A645F6R0_9ZZZZ